MDAQIQLRSARPVVAIVEDDTAVRRSLQLLLRSHGFDVRAYASAQSASADPQVSAAACLIADLVMPQADGIELLAGLRSDGWTGPAILISAFMTDATIGRARDCGFAHMLSKPFAEGKLVEIVKDLTVAA